MLRFSCTCSGAAGQAVLTQHLEQAKRHALEMEEEKKKEAEEKAAKANGTAA